MFTFWYVFSVHLFGTDSRSFWSFLSPSISADWLHKDQREKQSLKRKLMFTLRSFKITRILFRTLLVLSRCWFYWLNLTEICIRCQFKLKVVLLDPRTTQDPRKQKWRVGKRKDYAFSEVFQINEPRLFDVMRDNETI